MTTGDSEQPSQPFGATEYPSLENSGAQPDPNPPVDYPMDAGLPPPVYPPPYPGAAGYPGYPGVPGFYPGAYDPYRPSKPPGTNGMAIASLVISLCSLIFCCGATGFIGVILGIVGMRESKRTGQDGYGIALTGIIIGGICTAFWALMLMLYAIGTLSSFTLV
jgi:hypothetical protein